MIIINASYSDVSVTYTARGGQREFSFPFDYLRKAFVKVEVNEETILVQGTDYSVSDSKTVVLTEVPIDGSLIRIFRQTDTTRLVSWADASVLKAKDMTIQQVQTLHILEEQQTWVKENALMRNGKTWEARNFPIVNIAQPSQPDDAASKRYIDNLISSIQALDSVGVICDTVADMKKNRNLVAGQTVLTKGNLFINDGGQAIYNIRAKDIVADRDDGDFIIFLDNGYVAECIAHIGVTVGFTLQNGTIYQVIEE